jgi:hypothetical protein
MSTMMTAGPLTSIDGPLPQPRPYGLVATAEIVAQPDLRFGNGAWVEPYPADLPSVWVPCLEGSETKPDPIEQPDPDAFLPFGVVLPIFCSAGRGYPYGELVRRATAAFTAKETYGVERALAYGVGTSPSLDQATVLASGVSPAVGFKLLEDAIAQTGVQGMIHTTPGGVIIAQSGGGTIKPSGSGPNAKLATIMDTPVVAGGGYAGARPSGGAAAGNTSAWVFATGPVQLRRDEILVPSTSIVEAMDAAQNDITVYVERMYLYSWDTALNVAVLIQTT